MRKKKELLREKPYKVYNNNKTYGTVKVSIAPRCTLKAGDLVYQIEREDGIIELIPAAIFNRDDYAIQIIEWKKNNK